MTNKFEILERDDDILLFAEDTYTVKKFKQLVTIACTNKTPVESPKHYIDSITKIKIDRISLTVEQIKWENFYTIDDCKILKIGSHGWQEGKLRIQTSIQIDDRREVQVTLEFCPNEKTPPEITAPPSPLDDIRQSEEYKRLL